MCKESTYVLPVFSPVFGRVTGSATLCTATSKSGPCTKPGLPITNMRGYDPLLDYQCIQGLIHNFRKPSLSYFSRVLRATLFKQNLFCSTQIIPARSHPFIKIIQQKHENMVMQVCQKRITKYIQCIGTTLHTTLGLHPL